MNDVETIAALATPSGIGGVGIIRVSGPLAFDISQKILNKSITPRQAHYGNFYSSDQQTLDIGIALLFKNPNSFTGEDVLELQGHGGPVILDCLLQRVLECGARIAKPGEFSERAFINDKMDLAQAEAVSDLINASSTQAARSAIRSLQGEFSKHIHQLVHNITLLRVYVEAAIDFPEEEIDFLQDEKIKIDLNNIIKELSSLLKNAEMGVILKEGLSLVIAGKPNAGKSTLLNQLSGRDSAIVTDIPGTTRDIMREHINLDGIPLHIIDTAGLRQSEDVVEQIGVERALKAIHHADHILLMCDGQDINNNDLNNVDNLVQHYNVQFNFPEKTPMTIIINKCDLLNKKPFVTKNNGNTVIGLSAKTSEGLALLTAHIKQQAGLETLNEGSFMARRRHIDALQRAAKHLSLGHQQLEDHNAGELLAEECRLAQQCLGEITGEFTADDLLGEIFSSFCIGK